MIGKNVRHDAARTHVTGESIFIDDRGALPNEVFVGIVTAPIACGSLDKIHKHKALEHPNCLGVFTSEDCAAKHWGAIVHDQPILVVDKISYMDEAVCLIVTDNRYKIEEIKKLIKLDVTEEKPIFTINGVLNYLTIIRVVTWWCIIIPINTKSI